MNRIGFSKSTVCSLVALVLAVGCDQPTSTRIPEPFENARPDVRAAWEQALAADKANDYAKAMTALDWLNKQKLSDPQEVALSAERAEFSEKLLKAVMRNEPAAIQAYKNSQAARQR
jgi:2-hydroxychromene-2-carboxylate isomerase